MGRSHAPRPASRPVTVLLAAVGVFLGVFAGSVANIGTIFVGMQVLPPPEGVNPGDVASISANIDRYSVAQLLVPLAAHAIGTFVGAFVAALIASTPRSRLVAALVVGALSLVGGLIMAREIPNTPVWFIVVDLVVAYIPMALVGWALARRLRGGAASATS
jgi:hypothetical protein